MWRLPAVVFLARKPAIVGRGDREKKRLHCCCVLFPPSDGTCSAAIAASAVAVAVAVVLPVDVAVCLSLLLLLLLLFCRLMLPLLVAVVAAVAADAFDIQTATIFRGGYPSASVVATAVT